MARLAFCLLISTMALETWSQPSQPCNSSMQTEGAYATQVWEEVSPPELSPSVIVISISVNSESKLFIRARNSRTFEIVRGALQEPLAKALEQLRASHPLPDSPADGSKLLPIKWESASISREQFDELHRSFTRALASLVAHAQSRSSEVLVDGGRISLHNTQYRIRYSNDGYENLEATVEDTSRQPDPLVSWVHRMLTFDPKTNLLR